MIIVGVSLLVLRGSSGFWFFSILSFKTVLWRKICLGIILISPDYMYLFSINLFFYDYCHSDCPFFFSALSMNVSILILKSVYCKIPRTTNKGV